MAFFGRRPASPVFEREDITKENEIAKDAFFDSAGAAAQTITATGISSQQAFGSPTLVPDQLLLPTAIATGQAFGITTVIADQFVMVAAIASQEAHGVPVITVAGGIQYVVPNGIATANTFGSAKLNRYVAAGSVSTAESFGTATITGGVAPAPSTGRRLQMII